MEDCLHFILSLFGVFSFIMFFIVLVFLFLPCYQTDFQGLQ